MSARWTEEVAFANHLADLADQIAMDHFRRDPGVRTKRDGTLVTEADEAVERAIRAELRSTYPRHAILGEEEGATNGGPGGKGGYRWILDPIDGTNNYAWGIPVWATLIALEQDGEIVAGVASAPALGERYDAARGDGARRNGEPIRVSGVDELAQARVGYGTFRSFEAFGWGAGFARLLQESRSSRGFGDFWGHMLVAAGSLDVMTEPIVNVWDLAALIVIVEEAGGRLTDLEGVRRIDGGCCMTTNGLLHERALEVLRS